MKPHLRYAGCARGELARTLLADMHAARELGLDGGRYVTDPISRVLLHVEELSTGVTRLARIKDDFVLVAHQQTGAA